jgi:hypothetical protein
METGWNGDEGTFCTKLSEDSMWDRHLDETTIA